MASFQSKADRAPQTRRLPKVCPHFPAPIVTTDLKSYDVYYKTLTVEIHNSIGTGSNTGTHAPARASAIFLMLSRSKR